MGGAKYVIGSNKIKVILVHGDLEKTTPHAQLESFYSFVFLFFLSICYLFGSAIRRTLRTHLSFAIAHSPCLIN